MKKTLTFAATVTSLCIPLLAGAAEISVLASQGSAKVGDTVPLKVLISSEGESVNAFSGSIELPRGAVFVSIDFMDSIVPLWIAEPALEGDRIEFEGMIPGGFEGVFTPYASGREPGILFTAYVKLEREGKAVFAPRIVEAYQNDGLGTPVEFRGTPSMVDVRSDSANSQGLMAVSKVWIILGLSVFAVFAYILWRREQKSF